MALQQDLQRLREQQHGVEAVAYVDMGSSTVLGKSSAIDDAQERFDLLCKTASVLLAGASGEADEAVRLSATEALIVCRSADDPEEALCIVCAPDVDVAAVLRGARTTFASGGQGGEPAS